MRTGLLMLAIAAVLAGGAVGQPKDGDLVLSIINNTPTTIEGGFAYVDPSHPAAITTLVATSPNRIFTLARMAPNNSDLVVAMRSGSTTHETLANLQPNGIITTIASVPRYIGQFELDHDGYWILLNPHSPSSITIGSLLGIHHQSQRVTTFCQFGNASPSVHMMLVGLAIDWTPGSKPYAVATNLMQLSSFGAALTWSDRTGKNTTAIQFDQNFFGWIEHHMQSGDYIVQDSAYSVIARVTRSRSLTALAAFVGYAAKITQDDTMWVVGTTALPASKEAILRYDLKQRAVVTLMYFPTGMSAHGIEVYGSRRLVCDGQNAQPGGAAAVYIQSRKAGDGGKPYALACSLNCRPPGPSACLRFPNGEYLCLDYTDPLFWTSFMGWAPAVFQGFKGVLDSKGNAMAQVNIPSSLPKMNDMAIFVAGVIYDSTGVVTVTNTHWFVLP